MGALKSSYVSLSTMVVNMYVLDYKHFKIRFMKLKDEISLITNVSQNWFKFESITQ